MPLLRYKFDYINKNEILNNNETYHVQLWIYLFIKSFIILSRQYFCLYTKINFTKKTCDTIIYLQFINFLLCFRSLRCARILIHMNLFASFAITNFLWLIWYYLVLSNVDIMNENEVIKFMCRCYTLFKTKKYEYLLL